MGELKMMTAGDRIKKIKEMKTKDKMTLQEIGYYFGISKQRVWQLLNMKESYLKKLNQRTFPRRIKIMFDGEVKTLLTKY